MTTDLSSAREGAHWRLFVVRDRRGAAAVEFAIVGLCLMTFLFSIFFVGLHFYFQQSLDYAVQQAGRSVEIGRISAGYTQSEFVTGVLCPSFQPACSGLFVDLHPVSDYTRLTNSGVADAPDSTSVSGFQFCTGSPGQMMYVHVVYLAPSPVATILGLSSRDPIVANMAFINENPGGVTVTQSGGC